MNLLLSLMETILITCIGACKYQHKIILVQISMAMVSMCEGEKKSRYPCCVKQILTSFSDNEIEIGHLGFKKDQTKASDVIKQVETARQI